MDSGGGVLQGPHSYGGFPTSILEMLHNVKSHLLLFIQVICTKVTIASMLLDHFCISNLHSNYAKCQSYF